MARIVLLLSSPPTTPLDIAILPCTGLFGAGLGCTTGTRCFLPSLGQRGTAGAAQAQPNGMRRASPNNVSRDSPSPRDQTCPAAMLFREALA